MPMEQFDSHDEPSEETGTPIGRFISLTPSRSYLGGGLLLRQHILGHTPGALTACTDQVLPESTTPHRPGSPNAH